MPRCNYIRAMQSIPVQIQPFATFPLYGILPGGLCGCQDAACKRAGKHPRVRWGALAPGTHDVFFNDGSGRGVVCGRGVVVVDLDVRTGGKSGVAHFQALAAANAGEISPTYTVRTPSGGLHLYYRVPNGVRTKTSAGELGIGIDVRGDGGYVVMAGSPHTSGGVYHCVADVPIADCPAWLLPLVTRHESAAPAPTEHVQPIDLETAEGRRRLQLFQQACLTYPESISGRGGHAALWNLVLFGSRALMLPANAVYALIWNHFNPRCAPPWTPNELVYKIKSAIEKGQLPWNSVAPENWEADLRELVASLGKVDAKPAIVEAAKHVDPSVIVPRVRDAAHTYTFDPVLHTVVLEGEQPDKPRQISVTDAALVFATSPVWRGVFQYDSFFNHVLAVNPPCKLDAECGGLSDVDITRVQAWLERAGCKLNENGVDRAIRVVAQACPTDALRSFVDGLPTVSKDDAEHTLRALALGMMQGVSPLADLFVRKTLIGAVRRALQPGTKVDTMLVLYGDQGVGKTMAIEKLFGAEWYRSQMPDLGGRDASHALAAKWGVELGELDRVLRSESSTVKEFLTRTVDEYRAFGTGDKIRMPRRCIFIGTTNEPDFLRGDLEFRRFWPFEVGARIDFREIELRRLEIWAAAKSLAALGEEHWIADAEFLRAGLVRVHEQHTEVDPWEATILKAVEGKEHVQAGEAYLLAFGTLDLQAGEKVDARRARRVALILRRAGWRRVSTTVDGKTKNVFAAPNSSQWRHARVSALN